MEQINKVRFVSPEGATHFEVVLVLDNPGTLAEGMDASAGLTAADGTPIYPYQNGKLEYYESTKITAKATGPVERVSLLNYGDVKAGQLLVQLGAKDTDAGDRLPRRTPSRPPRRSWRSHQGAGEVQRRRPPLTARFSSAA